MLLSVQPHLCKQQYQCPDDDQGVYISYNKHGCPCCLSPIELFSNIFTMTEYDYSPEGYERYLATQRRIANWVNQTEHHRPQFGPTTQSVADTRTKHHRHYHRPPPSDSGSDDSYAAGPGYPGPMPGPMPGLMPLHSPPPPPMYPHQPIYQPMVPPLPSPGYTFPPIYPDHHRSSRSHRRSHSRSPRHPSAFHFTSPPTSPIYPHGYPPPPMLGYPPQGFVMMPPPPPPLPRGRKMSFMVSLTGFLHLPPTFLLLVISLSQYL